MATDCTQQLRLWDVGPQQVTVDFAGGELVTDAGLLAIRAHDKELGVLADLARRFPDPLGQELDDALGRCVRRRDVRPAVPVEHGLVVFEALEPEL